MAIQTDSNWSGTKPRAQLTTYHAAAQRDARPGRGTEVIPIDLGSPQSPDRHRANNGEGEKHCQSRIAVDDCQHEPCLLKEFHSAFPSCLRDELGGGVSSAAALPAGKVCAHICPWAQRRPLAACPVDRNAALPTTICAKRPSARRQTPIGKAPDKPLTTYQAAAAQRDARPGRIRRMLLVAVTAASIQPAWQFADYVARKTVATVALAEMCRGIPACNPLEVPPNE